ncbi:MAG: YigZ family protein [Clostridia bacterium]|nr:YigZ family protein [Clostridia bacterium]
MLNDFLTIKEPVSAEIVEKKSKFIAQIIPVISEEDAFEKLEAIKKENRDARHNVFSYRIANGPERASDDGEPSGTAGVPILDILRGSKLQNVLVVVTRYFGGILLGTGGLVKAYTDSTKEALKNAQVIEKVLQKKYEVEVPYSYNDKIVYFCKNNDYEIVDTKYEENAVLYIAVKNELSLAFEQQISDLSNREAQIRVTQDEFYA